MIEFTNPLLSAFTTVRLAVPSIEYSLASLLHPAFLLLCTMGFLSAANLLKHAYHYLKATNMVAVKKFTYSLLLCILLGLRRHPLAYLGLDAYLPPSLLERIRIAALITPFVRFEAALRPLASRFDANLPRPPGTPQVGHSYGGSLWAWFRPVRVASRHLAICIAALAHDLFFGTNLFETATKQGAIALAIACGAHLGDPYFEVLHIAFGVLVTLEENMPPESVLEIAKFVSVAVDIRPIPFSGAPIHTANTTCDAPEPATDSDEY
ncbi:hypothetical protein CspHIS471_0301390 [Cutaneotrichosporon sp. HIS471]|nr:hypothetical protein CspHIS471_0301390 [Cutaneotrichosporon sp. HIS471]